jgi:hypothetical protein
MTKALTWIDRGHYVHLRCTAPSADHRATFGCSQQSPLPRIPFSSGQNALKSVSAHSGVLAQLVERLNGIEEVRGSNPLGSRLLLLALARRGTSRIREKETKISTDFADYTDFLQGFFFGIPATKHADAYRRFCRAGTHSL